jgi:hypothetical protein
MLQALSRWACPALCRQLAWLATWHYSFCVCRWNTLTEPSEHAGYQSYLNGQPYLAQAQVSANQAVNRGRSARLRRTCCGCGRRLLVLLRSFVMANGTPGSGADYGVLASNVTDDTAYCRTF